jgi:glycosyltransferase involved in cell wall biosynthesis
VGWLNRPIMAYLRRFHNQGACTMVPTEALRSDLEGRGFERLKVVPRGVDTLRFHPARRSDALRAHWGVAADDLVVGYVGRLAAEKNLGVLLAAFRAIRKAVPRSRLLIVGDGPMRGELEAACPDAIFAGLRRGSDLAMHYASCDLFAFPSLTETFGNVTTEALASGLPIVAFDHAAAGLLIRSGDNGLLAPFGDTPAFVARAVELAADAGRRRAIAQRALATAQALDWDSVLARFEANLFEACATSGAAVALPADEIGEVPHPDGQAQTCLGAQRQPAVAGLG